MIKSLFTRFSTDQGLSWRALRSSAWTLLGNGGSQVIRLGVNLLLARALFPSAFGTMALVMVVIQALNNFSDVGTRPAVLRSERGDDPDFLNTAWTIEILRGVMLWLVCCAVAVPFAHFYNAPELAPYLFVAGFTMVLQGAAPLRFLTAERHLSLGQLTKADLFTQLITSGLTVLLAWATGSVWSLVVMLPLGALIRIVVYLWIIPGHRDRLHWDRSAVRELTQFGKWIFPSTIMGALISLGDKAILGRHLTLTQMGLYNIGYFLASFPMSLMASIISRIMIPLCRESPPSAGPDEFRRIRRVRFGLTGMALAITLMVALLGPWIVDLLYDERYQQSGLIVTMVACVMVPQIIVMGYDMMILTTGDSRGFFFQVFFRAILFLGFFALGSQMAGLFGALVGQAVGNILHYPVIAWFARKHGAWDPLHDGVYALIAAVALALILWPRMDAVLALAQMG